MESEQARLVIDPEVAELGVVATYLVVTNLRNRKSDAEFERHKTEACKRLREEYTEAFVRDDPVIAGFRELRRRIGRSARKYPCSIEGLISSLVRTGGIPSINLAVDMYNLVSLETRLTLGAHDLDRVAGDITLRMARGGESFVPLGGGKLETVAAGDYHYVDEGGEVLCRLDYRQGDKTKVTLDTRRCLFIIQGNPNTPMASVEAARDQLGGLIDTVTCPAGREPRP